ncbi:hypothetical protein EV359DRAFT_75619 [Lentinula novae-zelandiae]|nr:hypothetical protein EV359DRAFT_75619 [Lentinula novae-zelandiae]
MKQFLHLQKIPFFGTCLLIAREFTSSHLVKNRWAPFTSRMDWEVAHWAKMRGTGSTAFSDLLAIHGVCEALGLSYKSSTELNSIIDTELPAQRPTFVYDEVVIAGEAFDIYKRPIMECIQALYSSPDHARYLCVAPECHYSDANKTNRLYHDMQTGKWWWSTQKQLEKDKPGATIVPVILSGDKTQITLFCNKSAYPVYLTIGNLPKEIRRKPLQQGQILLAYLPTTRLQHISVKASQRCAVANLFHASMRSILFPLKEAGIHGVIMTSGDGIHQRCHPILAVYVGDYPEQVLVMCSYYGRSPVCMTSKDRLGDYPCTAEFWDPVQAIGVAKLLGTNQWAQSCLNANLRPVQHPFWEDLPYTNIFQLVTPDILHQLYQGVMKHLVGWIVSIVGASEVDARHKQMCTFLLALVTDIPKLSISQSRRLTSVTRALLDFLDNSLGSVEAALAAFHENKGIFVELGAREHFNLPKIHYLCHYVCGFKLFGASDNYNTETTERLHIDFAKNAYWASNQKDEYSQMTKWLERREKVIQYASYLSWRSSQKMVQEPENSQAASDLIVPGVCYKFPGSQQSLQDMQCCLTQQLTKFPTKKTVSFSKLAESNPALQGYGATNFDYALRKFISRLCYPQFTAGQLKDMTAFLSLPFQSIPVWHWVKFRNEDVYGNKTLDVVTAYPRYYNSEGKNEDGSGEFLQGMQIGWSITPPSHLAYVEWFTKFPQKPEPHMGLYHGSHATSVIPLEAIQRSVHLYPKWGGSVPSSWTHESVLDESPSFLLSSFKDTHMYFNMS